MARAKSAGSGRRNSPVRRHCGSQAGGRKASLLKAKARARDGWERRGAEERRLLPCRTERRFSTVQVHRAPRGPEWTSVLLLRPECVSHYHRVARRRREIAANQRPHGMTWREEQRTPRKHS